jgi:hypothetical protein
MTKNTAFFVASARLSGCLVTPSMRRWLASPWPYLGGALAGLIFLPNILWNAHNHWATFGLQVSAWNRTLGAALPRRIVGGLVGMATPFTFMLAAMGLAWATRSWREARLSVLAATLWRHPCLFHLALAARPRPGQLAVLTSFRLWRSPPRWPGSAPTGPVSGLMSRGFPALRRFRVALALLAFVYAQAFFNVVPLGRKDPMTRLMGVGIASLAPKWNAPGSPTMRRRCSRPIIPPRLVRVLHAGPPAARPGRRRCAVAASPVRPRAAEPAPDLCR